MKRTTFFMLLSACSALLLAGCDVKDPIFHTPHPGKGVVAGITDWTQRGEGVDIPAEYRVEAAATTATASGTAFVVPGLFESGNREVVAYNVPSGVNVNAGIATVNTGAEASALLVPDPGILFSGTAVANVTADDTVRITLPMRQLMRQVQFGLTVSGGNPEGIAAIDARLEGVAASIDLKTGKVTGEAAAVRIPFVRTGNKLTAGIWVVGMIPSAAQRIVVVLTFANGTTTVNTSDVSDAFLNFNADKLIPLGFAGNVEAPAGAEVGGTINDWKENPGTDVDVNM